MAPYTVDLLDNPNCMAVFFAQEAQSSLYKMKTRRARLLGLTDEM
jgi:hypothetical protein